MHDLTRSSFVWFVVLGCVGVSLASCRGCREDAPPGRKEAVGVTDDAVSPPRNVRGVDAGVGPDGHGAADPQTGELCYLAMHYGPVAVDLATLTGDETLTCSALEPPEADWACDDLCAVARRLGADVRLAVSLSPVPAEPGATRALRFDRRAVRTSGDEILAVLEAPDEGGPIGYQDAARARRVVAQAVSVTGADGARVDLAVEPEVPLALALDALAVPTPDEPLRVDLLTAPVAGDWPPTEPAREADALAVAGRIELAATEAAPSSDDVLLAVSRGGARVGVRGAWLDGAPPGDEADALDDTGWSRDLDALAAAMERHAAMHDSVDPYRGQLWLWVDDGVPAGRVIAALDVVGFATEPGSTNPARDAAGQPRPRFDAPVAVQLPQVDDPEQALPPDDMAVPVDDGQPAPTEAPPGPKSFEGGDGLAPGAVHQAVGAQTPALDACHAAYVQGGGMALDAAVFVWTVDAEGRVVDSAVEGVDDDALARCFLDALDAMTFAPPAEGRAVEVRYPLGFSIGE